MAGAAADSMKKVLVVDDEADIAEILRLLLDGDGVEVLVVHDGRQALDLDEDEPDLP